MRIEKVGLVTCRRLPELDADDRPLLEALVRRGVSVFPAIWDDPAVRWTELDVAVLRSVWDYHLRPDAFRDWLARLEGAGVPLWNPPAVVRENSDKLYLRKLEQAGIPILPTEWLEGGSSVELERLFARRGWTAAVVKPAISASAYRTRRVARESARSDQGFLDSLLQTGAVLVQEFAPEISDGGEWSFVFLGGRYSHAVRKVPAPGDFRVQHELGGRVFASAPSETLRRDAETILARAACPHLYARVDAIERGGRLVLMELELVEPTLFLRHDRGAADRLADAIVLAAQRRPASPAVERDPVRIRFASAEDAASIASLLSDAFAEYESSYTPRAFAATTPPATQIAERMREGPVFAAVRGETLVGTVGLVARDEELHLRGMAVAPVARGSRIGERLLERVERFGVETCCRRLSLDTTPFLDRAIRLYERWGFRRIGAETHDLFGTPLFTMVKPLDRAGERPRPAPQRAIKNEKQSPRIRPARSEDLESVRRLLGDAGLPVEGLETGFDDGYVVALVDGEIVGAEGIERWGDCGLLRSAVVGRAWQGRGVGDALTRERLSWARARGLRALYLLTTTAEDYFPRFGFRRVRREDVPAEVRRSAEFVSACPASAVVLALDL